MLKILREPALRDYESRVLGHADTLVRQLQARSGQEVDASLWFNFYSFDVMGDLAFGSSFDVLASGKKVRLLLLFIDILT